MFKSNPIVYPICLTPFVLSVLLSAAACDSKSETSDARAADADESPPDQAKPAIELVEYELDIGGAEWQGWVASAPAGCDVMEDGPLRVRIACGRRPRFDVLFDQAEVDLEARKKDLAAVNAKTPDTLRTVTKDEANALAWKIEDKEYDITTLSFLDRSTVSGVVITCGNLPTRPVADEDALALHRRACASLAKKK